MIKDTHEFVKADYLKGGIKLLNIYQGTKHKNDLECLKYGHKWQAIYSDFKNRGSGCRKCVIESKKYTQESVKKAYLKEGIIFTGIYVNSDHKNDLECLKYGHKWSAPYSIFIKQKSGCPRCAIESRKHTQEFVEADYLKGNIKLLSRYVGALVKNDLQCLICNHLWKANYGNFQSNNCGCPECWRLLNRGENHGSWNSELTKEDRENCRGLNRHNDVLWVKAVFDRDNYICQCCGYSKGGTLNAHHIAGWATHKSERFNVDNGVTLCKPCHDSYHYDFNPSVIDHDSFYHWMVLYSVIKPENWLWTIQYPKSMNGWLKAFKQAS